MKNNLNKLRWERNMTFDEISKRTGISVSQLTKIANGDTKDIYYSTACEIAKALKCELKEVFPY